MEGSLWRVVFCVQMRSAKYHQVNMHNFPVTQTNFRFEPPNFPVAGWMLIGLGSFFGLKKNFLVSVLHFSGFDFDLWLRPVSMGGQCAK